MLKPLRPYQEKFKAEILRGIAEHDRVIACSATGSGKTMTFLHIANELKTVLILTESRKIFSQIADAMPFVEIKAGGEKDFFIKKGVVHIAMAQTLARRQKLIAQFAAFGSELAIINDEAHIGTTTKILRQISGAKLIGFTATPDYDVAKHLPTIYNSIVIGPQPQELVENGYLSPYYHFSRESETTALKVEKGEYTEESQYQAFATTKVYSGLLEDMQNFKFKKAIIFCSSIKHCIDVVKELRNWGYSVAEVHSENKDSDIELNQFMKFDVDICVSVGILTKGFDFTPIDLVVLLRATTSLALYCQMIGRGSRISEGKKKFTVLDYGENGRRHGLWNYEHDWATMWKGSKKRKKKEGEGAAPVKECPKCLLYVHPKIMTCPSCGYQWKPKNKEQDEGILVELTDQMNQLRGKYIGDLTAKELVLYAKITGKKPFAVRVAKGKGCEFLKEFAAEMGYKKGWLQYQDLSQPIDFYNILIK